MKRKRISVEHIVAMLKQADLGRALQDQTPAEFAKRAAENLLREPVITAGDSL